MREVIPANEPKHVVYYTVSEDNNGCINLVEIPKTRPRTKHIALTYLHFRSYIKRKAISISYIKSPE